VKYDDASWHYEGNFPEDLPSNAAGTHIGMFLAWCLLHGLAGSLHTEESPNDLEALQERKITPGRYLIKVCDEKLTSEDFNEEGNGFAQFYYASGDDYGAYLDDYSATLEAENGSIYQVEDTWQNFDRLAPVIEGRYKEWKDIQRR